MFALGGRLRAPRPAPGRVDALARAIGSMRGGPALETFALARRAAANEVRARRAAGRRDFRSALRALGALAPAMDRAELMREEDRPAPFLLSVPMTIDTVALVAALARTSARVLVIEETPLSALYLHALAPGGNVLLLRPEEMVRRNRAFRAARAPDRSTYVTFPDHHFTKPETCREVRYFGEEHLFPVLEPLLFFRGIAPLFTVEPDGSGRRLRIRRFAEAPPEGAPTEPQARALLAWLAGRLQATLCARPENVLSWTLAPERSRRRRSVRAALELRLVEGFLRAWSAADRRRGAAALAAWIASTRPEALERGAGLRA